jgi:hypothetical protein
VGEKVAVYYNPANPADSLLRPGLEGFDLFMAMCLLPFNVLPLGILAAAGRRIWGRCFGYSAAGAKLWDDGFVVRVRLPPAPAMFFAFLAAGVLAFIAIFPIVFFYGGVQPPKWLMYRVWPVVLGGAALVYFATKWKQSRGGYDLVIDATAGKVVLPRSAMRKLNLVMPLHELTSIEVHNVGLPGSRGGPFAGYYPTAIFTDTNGIRRPEALVTWGDPRRAEALTAWLRHWLKLRCPGQATIASGTDKEGGETISGGDDDVKLS